jgi:hypothetical protein
MMATGGAPETGQNNPSISPASFSRIVFADGTAIPASA